MQTARVAALQSIDFDVSRGEFFVLLGPSGCGKTTILRSIAGLERPDGGVIRIDGETVFSAHERIAVPPERRPIAMVFQSYAVWPHMTVHENVAFPLREGVRPLAAAQLRARVAETLSLLGLSEMAERPVTTLSGGQQQRVALARALALRPKVLLMDEPLSNLDFKLQIQLRSSIRDLVRHFDLTTVYVTHNQAEAMEIGDRIAVVDHGEIVQMGTPRDIYRAPQDEFVARFIGEMGFLPAELVGYDADHALLDTAAGRMRARAPKNMAYGTGCLLGVRPEDLALIGEGEKPDGNIFEGEILRSRFLGEAVVYGVRIGDAELTFKTHHRFELPDRARVRLTAAAQDCVTVLPRRSTAAASNTTSESLARAL
jgi:ABC-type Fe3+/spermidine/putrescine transport system ATPase subunit